MFITYKMLKQKQQFKLLLCYKYIFYNKKFIFKVGVDLLMALSVCTKFTQCKKGGEIFKK